MTSPTVEDIQSCPVVFEEDFNMQQDMYQQVRFNQN